MERNRIEHTPNVKLLCANEFVGVIIDRFGKDVSIVKVDNEHFSVNIKVAVSRQFFAWVMSLGEGVKVIEPEAVVEQMRKEVCRLLEQYEFQLSEK